MTFEDLEEGEYFMMNTNKVFQKIKPKMTLGGVVNAKSEGLVIFVNWWEPVTKVQVTKNGK